MLSLSLSLSLSLYLSLFLSTRSPGGTTRAYHRTLKSVHLPPGELHGYLAHKKQFPPRTLQWAYDQGPMVLLVGAVLCARYPRRSRQRGGQRRGPGPKLHEKCGRLGSGYLDSKGTSRGYEATQVDALMQLK